MFWHFCVCWNKMPVIFKSICNICLDNSVWLSTSTYNPLTYSEKKILPPRGIEIFVYILLEKFLIKSENRVPGFYVFHLVRHFNTNMMLCFGLFVVPIKVWRMCCGEDWKYFSSYQGMNIYWKVHKILHNMKVTCQ